MKKPQRRKEKSVNDPPKHSMSFLFNVYERTSLDNDTRVASSNFYKFNYFWDLN